MKHVNKLLLSAAPVLIVSSLAHPFGRVKSRAGNRSILVGGFVTPQVKHVLERSCQNCHSEKTDWPWYSYVPPLSWMIEGDVPRARNHLNLSRWDDYTTDERAMLLSRIAVMVRNRAMPLPQYLLLHAEAKLSDMEVKLVDSWAHGERKRLKSIVSARDILFPSAMAAMDPK